MLRWRVYALVAVVCILFLWTTLQLHRNLPGNEFNPDDGVPPQRDKEDKDSFSACLLVMDDNHFLIEWLAYHHFVLPLRDVVIAVDPRSQTSPDSILARWKDRIHITKWTDEHYMNTTELAEAELYVKMKFKQTIAGNPNLVRHRARQRLMYYKCMRHFKSKGKSWVVLIDTDEFLHVNYPTVAAWNLTAPTIQKEGSVLTFLKNELQNPGHNLSNPCVQIPRLRFGAMESADDLIRRHVPSGFNAMQFQTLRWRKHAHTGNININKISKTMIDLSRVNDDDLKPVDSIHLPLRSLCKRRHRYIKSEGQLFLINHYLGSREQYFYRNDARAGKERSEEVRGK